MVDLETELTDLQHVNKRYENDGDVERSRTPDGALRDVEARNARLEQACLANMKAAMDDNLDEIDSQKMTWRRRQCLNHVRWCRD
ncbi:MAG TPA: hypothetical protein VGO47_00370 [Chlamydiales bacterium]|nr:hypothetical protein [Chlamydiales bacterium]